MLRCALPVIPIVLYAGELRWTAAVRDIDLVKFDAETAVRVGELLDGVADWEVFDSVRTHGELNVRMGPRQERDQPEETWHQL